jgi:hypothetical protein
MSDFQYLPLSVKNLSISLEEILEAIKTSSTWEYKSLYFDRIANFYKQVGIGELLMTDDESALHRHLQLGIQAYVEFLQNAAPAEIATSKISAFLDAVCMADVAAMTTLAQLAPTQRNPRKEYEEDFLYMRILMDVFGLGKTLEDVQGLLDEFEAFHAENPDQRFTALTALLTNDAQAFHDALETLIVEHETGYAKGGDLYQGTVDEAPILAAVSTEVAALVKLAKKQGMAVAAQYSLAPSSVMIDCVLPAPAPRSWLAYRSPYRSFSLS